MSSSTSCKIATRAALLLALFALALSGCGSSKKSSASTDPKIPANGSAAASVRSYLDACALFRPGITQPFLAHGNMTDLATEFDANRQAGWIYNRTLTRFYNETDDAKSGKATVTASIVVQGGVPPTYMAVERTFQLVAQDNLWKIASMDPPPQTHPSGATSASK